MIYLRRITGGSMAPAFKAGKLILFVRRRVYRPYDVVLFENGGKEKMKRIFEIENDKIYVLGDNAASSTDSRHFGWIGRKQIKGSTLKRNAPEIDFSS